MSAPDGETSQQMPLRSVKATLQAEGGAKLMVQKLGILKKALAAERRARQHAEARVADLEKKIRLNEVEASENETNLRALLKKKETQAVSLFHESEQLRATVESLQSAHKVKEGVMPEVKEENRGWLDGLGGGGRLREDLRRLKSDNDQLTAELRMMRDMFERQQASNLRLQSALSIKERELVEARRTLDSREDEEGEKEENSLRALRNARDRAAVLEIECRRQREENLEISREKSNLQVELEVWKRKAESAEQSTTKVKESAGAKGKEAELLRVKVQELEGVTRKMAAKLVTFKSQLATLQLTVRQWRCMKINRLIPNVEAILELVKNPSSGAITLEISSLGKVQSYPLATLMDVHLDRNPLTRGGRFMVVYSSDRVDMFESDDARDIVSAIQEMIHLDLERAEGGNPVLSDIRAFLGEDV